MRKRSYQVAVCAAVTVMTLGFNTFVQAQPNQQNSSVRRFSFALIGDLQYNAEEEAKFPNLIDDINRANVAFTVHDGDFKSGSSLCTDQLSLQRRDQFQTFAAPFVFLFGDNEWTDCHRPAAGGFDPLERLEKLRELFTEGDRSLGQRPLRLTRQSSDPNFSKFRENVRWIYRGVTFVGLNIPGSNNNLGRTPTADAEYRERNAATLAWIRQGFAEAKRLNSPGIMLVMQADPGFELKADNPERTGFNDFLATLEAETIAFGKPVVLVHGDSHYFRIDKPLIGTVSQRRIENFTRVQTFGTPDVHWVRAQVDPSDPNLFRFEQRIVPKNVVPQK
jgi:Calcineurin-like phosphoesterase